jgi:hypothetical protein
VRMNLDFNYYSNGVYRHDILTCVCVGVSIKPEKRNSEMKWIPLRGLLEGGSCWLRRESTPLACRVPRLSCLKREPARPVKCLFCEAFRPTLVTKSSSSLGQKAVRVQRQFTARETKSKCKVSWSLERVYMTRNRSCVIERNSRAASSLTAARIAQSVMTSWKSQARRVQLWVQNLGFRV